MLVCVGLIPSILAITLTLRKFRIRLQQCVLFTQAVFAIPIAIAQGIVVPSQAILT